MFAAAANADTASTANVTFATGVQDAPDTMFAAAANADTASTANVTYAAGVQDASIVLAPTIACAVATPRRSSSRVKNVATTHYLKKATALNCNSAMQASAAIRSSANYDERNDVIDLEHSVVCVRLASMAVGDHWSF
jgi:hypothetical protein